MSDKKEIEQKVIDVIAQVLNIDKDTIKADSTFDSLGADSLDRLEIIMKIEETFDVHISDEQESAISTIAQAVEAIDNLRKQ